MGKVKKIARRTFLVGSAAVAGGVAFGVYRYKTPHANPLADNLADGEASFNAWVKIAKDGITLITPHSDVGQGTTSMQALLIAEEMDIEFGQFKTEFGRPDAAYWNTSLGGNAPEINNNSAEGKQRNGFGGMGKLIGLQVTGGSSSVPDSYNKLRQAGAIARETLKLAASQKTGVPVDQLATGNAAVMLPDGTSLTYVALAELAAEIEPVRNVTLRDPKSWTMIGKKLQRTDITAKSTGTQPYGIDLQQAEMVHAAIRTNPRQGGKMNGYDSAAAETMRGVDQIVPVKGGVAVIADNSWRAMKAANAIEFDWGPADYPAEMGGHWQTVSDGFNAGQQDSRERDDGNIEDGLKSGNVVEAEYRVPYLAHQPLEPLNALIKVTDERVDVWSGVQIPRFVQSNVADITGISKDNVHIHNMMTGGSFGHRLEDEQIKQCAEIAMQLKGTPVKLTYSREEDFIHDFGRPLAMARGRGSVKDGRINTFDLSICSPSVSESQMGRQGLNGFGADDQIVAGATKQPFEIPNYRVTGYRAEALAPVSSWRSVGASFGGFFHDSFLDELIAAAGADPLEERLRLISDKPSRDVLEAVAEMSGWGKNPGENRARGIGFCTSFGVPVAEVVEISMREQGIKIENVWVAANVGRVIDPVNFEAQVSGGVIWGLGHAMNCELTYADGMAEQTNYHAHQAMRINQAPRIEVRGLETASKIRGIGEPPVPPAAPALGNAIFAATGKRIRELPFSKSADFA